MVLAPGFNLALSLHATGAEKLPRGKPVPCAWCRILHEKIFPDRSARNVSFELGAALSNEAPPEADAAARESKD